MANTYTQCYFHLVFAVKNRESLINNKWKKEMEMYITGIIRNYGHKMIAIGSMPDHLHILVGYNVNQLIPELVEKIKTSTNNWIREKRMSKFRFEWQKGYGAFTHSRDQIDIIVKYIISQEEHHRNRHFKEEYLEILNRNNIEYDPKYLFEFLNKE